MTRFVSDSATASGQIAEGDESRVKAISFHARSTNPDSVIVGDSGVSSTNGYELTKDASIPFNFEEGSVPLSTFYVHFLGVGRVDWAAILLD